MQLSNANEVQKLYVNQSMDPHTPVTVEVERDGLYLVTIFPIREGRGILDSDAEIHVLGEFSITETTVSSTPTTLFEGTYVICMWQLTTFNILHAATAPTAFNLVLTAS